MIYTHAPVPGAAHMNGRCLFCGRWVHLHANWWRRTLWRYTGIMM